MKQEASLSRFSSIMEINKFEKYKRYIFMNKKIFVLSALLLCFGILSVSAQTSEANAAEETAVEAQAPAKSSAVK